MTDFYCLSITYAAPRLGIPMALRIKLRPWKNRIKKIHMNAKELSLLGGWTKRGIKGEMRESHREWEGRGGGREREGDDNHQ